MKMKSRVRNPIFPRFWERGKAWTAAIPSWKLLLLAADSAGLSSRINTPCGKRSAFIKAITALSAIRTAYSANGSRAAIQAESVELQSFSESDAEAIANAEILGESIWEAEAEGWAGEWLFLYIYGNSDPSPSREAEIEHTKPTTDILLYGISYEEAADAGWGDIWLDLMNHMDDSGGDYLLPSDSAYITTEDLVGHTQEELSLMRNEIYARHGYNFQNESLRNYFLAQSWYVPIEGVNADTFGSDNMSPYERANLKTIMDYEREMGWRN